MFTLLYIYILASSYVYICKYLCRNNRTFLYNYIVNLKTANIQTIRECCKRFRVAFAVFASHKAIKNCQSGHPKYAPTRDTADHATTSAATAACAAQFLAVGDGNCARVVREQRLICPITVTKSQNAVCMRLAKNIGHKNDIISAAESDGWCCHCHC